MKICAQCNSIFTDDRFFCLNDGTTLTSADAEQETMVSRRVESPHSPENVSVANENPICRSCETENRGNTRFCKKCGGAMPASAVSGESNIFTPSDQINFQLPQNDPGPDVEQVRFIGNPDVPSSSHHQSPVFVATPSFQTPNFNPPVSAQNNFAARQGVNKFLVAGVILGLLVVSVVAWLLLRDHPMAAKLDAAINSNKIISPSGDNAYEYYHQMKKDGIKPDALKKFEDRLFPILTEKPAEVLKTVTEPGYTEKDPEEWQDAAKMFDWASEMHPADSQLAAKAAYCKGRVEYLNNQKDAAVEDWKKAADLDKKWGLALNGIGLINNEQKNYETAKTFLRQAIEREPGWALPYNNLGSAYYFQKRYPEAMPYYQKAIEISPKWARPHAWLASIAMENYDYQTAVNEFEKVLAPDALGTSEMNMTAIHQQYEKAKSMTMTYTYPE
jgi:tetratricopeptide (TPR) repeat protein